MASELIYITGGSSGIGLSLARLYAGQGSDVVLIARNATKLGTAVAECEGLRTSAVQKVTGVSLDITDYENLAARFNGVMEEHGVPNLVILCAGTAANATFLDTSADAFDDVMNINFAGSRELVRQVLPPMLQRGSGKIGLVSSMAGLTGIYGYSAYSASKFAVNGLAQALSQELDGTGVSVHVICPPEVNTPMIEAESASAVPQTRFLKDLVGTMEPDVVAVKIARGLQRGKEMIVPSFRAKVMAGLARHFPTLFAWCSQQLLRWKFG